MQNRSLSHQLGPNNCCKTIITIFLLLLFSMCH